MTSKVVQKKLANLGFSYDESVTGKHPVWGGWSGTIDPVGKKSLNGECRGICVSGATRAEMDADALQEAAAWKDRLKDCADSTCDMHGEVY